MKRLYLFDFDGTISSKDSFIDFLLKTFGLGRILLLFTLNIHRLIFVILRGNKSKLKEFILAIFLKGKSKEEIEQLGKEYYTNYFTTILRPKAMLYIKKRIKEAHTIYIVSASLEFWLKPFTDALEIGLICTKLQYKENKFTGFFEDKNCKGVEKVKRISKEIDINSYNEILAFGNSRGDKEMLETSTKPYYKYFE